MKKISHKLRLTVMSSLGLAVVAASGFAVANAAASPTATATRTGVARYTIRTDRLIAKAEVLGVTQSQLQSSLKAETLKQAYTAKGFTKATFREKVRAQLSSDLLAQGYTQAQVTKALSHHRK